MLTLTSSVPNRQQHADVMRRCALERLYLRKAAIDDLIHSLENYIRTQRTVGPATCIPISASSKWS